MEKSKCEDVCIAIFLTISILCIAYATVNNSNNNAALEIEQQWIQHEQWLAQNGYAYVLERKPNHHTRNQGK